MENFLGSLLLLSLIYLSPAQAYVGKNLKDQSQVSFPSAGKKGTVVVFLSARCPCSESHEVSLKRLYEQYAPLGFEFVAVHSNQDESEAFTQAHFNAALLPFPVIQDQGAELASQFKAIKTPHVFLLQNNQIIFQGGVDDSAQSAKSHKHYLADALQETFLGKPVTLAQVRTLGCAIKR